MYFLKLNKITLSLLLIFSLTACQNPQDNTVTPEINTPTQSNTEVSGKPVRIGILSIDSAVSVNERYRPLLDYLEQTIGRPFELVTLSQDSQFIEVKASNLDFTTNNPLAAVQLRRLYDTEFLVTNSRPKTGTLFSALIVVKQDTDPQLVRDVKEALLNIPPEHPALLAAGIENFAPVEDYEQLDRLIKNLKLKSWDTK